MYIPETFQSTTQAILFQRAHDVKNDVVLTSMRRDYVALTSIRRHFGAKCPLGLLSALNFCTLFRTDSWPAAGKELLAFRLYRFALCDVFIYPFLSTLLAKKTRKGVKGKLRRSRSDATSCGVWSVSTMFVNRFM